VTYHIVRYLTGKNSTLKRSRRLISTEPRAMFRKASGILTCTEVGQNHRDGSKIVNPSVTDSILERL
jgi:hypothetical protein